MGYLKISEFQVRALNTIASISDAEFRNVASKLISQAKPSIRGSELLEQVKTLSSNPDFSVALCTQLVSLATYRRIQNININEVVASLFKGMENAKFPEETKNWFDGIRDDFTKLLDCESVRLLAKSLHLSTDFDRLFSSANVITDVRPVFDVGRTSVAGAIVTQTLRIHYMSDGGTFERREISLALDLNDIDNLIAELDKAKLKAQCAKECYGEKTGEDIFINGEETYGFS